jgi:fibronectin type 3 domain-containing protein
VTGSITITGNATNGSSLGVPITGIGVSTASHSVALTWHPSSSSGVSGYYVYRATTSGGPYTRIDSSAVSGTNYTDSAVSSGATYYYAVTALGTDGIESGYSNQVTAVVP